MLTQNAIDTKIITTHLNAKCHAADGIAFRPTRQPQPTMRTIDQQNEKIFFC